MRMGRRIVASALVCLAPAVPALGQDDAQKAAQQVEVTFAPPVDKPLRFRVSQTRQRPGQPGTAASWVEEMRFARTGEGWLLRWHIDPASLPEAMKLPALAPMMKPFTGDPIAFELDAEGTPLRIHDWESVRPRILETVDATANLPGAPGDKADRAKAIAQIRPMFANMTAEQAPAVVLKNIQPALGWGGSAMAMGETRSDRIEQQVPVFDISVTQAVTTTLSAVEPGRTATFTTRREIPPEALRAMMQQLLDRLGLEGDAKAKARADMERQLAGSPLSVTDLSEVTIDLATGLPVRLRNRRLASVQKTPIETLDIEWLR